MRSIVIPEPGKVKIEEVPMVQKNPGEAILKILYGGVCGSDLGTYRGFEGGGHGVGRAVNLKKPLYDGENPCCGIRQETAAL